MANAQAATVALVDVASRSIIGAIDVNPARVKSEGPGAPNYAQDTDVSPDGRTLYVSRGYVGDVAAFDIASGRLLWQRSLDTGRADHMTITPDGRSLFVSAMMDNRVYRIATATGEITGHLVTGVYPHDNKVSRDGRWLYNTSIGPLGSMPRQAGARPLDETPGYPFQLTIADVGTLQIRDRIRFDKGIRPWDFTPDEKGLYAQLSNEHAVVAYSLAARKVIRRLDLPVKPGVTVADWDFEAPHHGLALTPDGRTLCLAGRASDYAALVRAPDLTLISTIPVGDAPGWAETADNGRVCLIANTRSDDLSIISIPRRAEIARLPIGDGPKHITVARIPASVIAAFKARAAKPQTPASARSFPAFRRVLLLEKTSDTSANVSIGDLNGDGKLDIFLAKGRHWPLMSRVLLGDGRGHFLPPYNLGESQYRSYSGRLADVDGDGDLDVVLSNDTPDPKLVYLNDGKGRFRVGSAYGRAEWETRNASVADLNGDGQPDIIVANRTDKAANYICMNKGKGRFDADCVAFSNESATSITPADFNRDGLIDLAVPYRDGGQSYVYLASGKAEYSNVTRAPFGPPDAEIRITEAADIDGDGLLDIVAIDERRGVAIYFGQKDGSFSAGLALSDGKARPYALAVSDLNGDGSVDIVVGHVKARSTIYFNDRSGRRYTPLKFGDGKGTVYGFAIADLDGDGLLDIAVARSDAPNAVYFASPSRSRTR